MRILKTLFRLLIFLLGILIAIGVYFMRIPFPKTSGELRIAGLKAPVEVIRDHNGVPHIYASNQHDLFLTQGFIHAQDRFWQMDFWRHIGSGRISEMFGKTEVDTDRFLRTLGWSHVVEQELKQTDPNSIQILNAYSDGVNAYLADHTGTKASLEYLLLKLVNGSYKIEKWTPLHSLTWAKAMAWDLRGNMDEEIVRSILLKTLTPAQVDELYPAYPPDHPYIVDAGAQSIAPASSVLGSSSGSTMQALEITKANLQLVDRLLGRSGVGVGSNNWVISGKRTVTGKPILANDPHLGAQMPSIWYEVGLHCQPKSADCPYDVTGYSFAGDPGVVIGHNDRIAWGYTNVGPDVMDLYIEKINPQNPNQYEVNGNWVDMQLLHETIQVAGGQPVPITIRYTRHGPIISDSFRRLEHFEQRSGLKVPQNYVISLRWTALEFSNTFRAIWKLDRATNWNEFRDAASDFAVPSQNWIYADVDGNIGYQTPGKIPIRKSRDGRYPVPGWTDEYEWTGYIPFDELPHVFNPEKGYVATANNQVINNSYSHLLATDWDYGYRAQRIVNMIESHRGPISISDVQTMQGDNRDLLAEQLVPVLLQIDPQNASLFRGWNYQLSMDSAPAALYEAFWKHLLNDAFADDLPAEFSPTGGSRWFQIVRNILQKKDSSWWDDRTTKQRETRNAIMKRALHEAHDELRKTLGPDESKWRWGALHTVKFENQTLGKTGFWPVDSIFNRGPYQTSGGDSIVNACGWDATEGYEVDNLPSMRMIVDLSNLGNSLAILTTGQSGHSFHPHYVDMADRWRQIQYHPMLWNRKDVLSHSESVLKLLP